MRAIALSRAAPTSTINRVVAVAAAVLVLGMTGLADAASHGGGGMGGPGDPDDGDYPPDSDAGVTPELFSSMQGGGDLRCTHIDEAYTGTAHFETGEEEPVVEMTSDDGDDHEHPEPPGELDFDVVDKVVSWSADFPIAAVIVKGGSRSYSYEYIPAAMSDGGLVTPKNNGGNPADVSSLRFCWEGDPPVEPVELTCDGVDDVVPLGPVMITAGSTVGPLPSGIASVTPNAVDIAFTAEEPVAAVVVAASEPELFPFDPTVTSGTVDVALDGEDAEVLFCVTQVADDPGGSDDDTSGSDDDTVTTQTDDTDTADDAADDTDGAASVGDPTTIPTGGGPAGRTPLALVAFVIIALSGSTGLLLWSRGG